MVPFVGQLPQQRRCGGPAFGRRACRALRSSIKDQQGATAVEFALVALPLLSVILFLLQLAIVFFFDQALQTLTMQAARLLKVGSAQQQGMTQTQFRNAVCTLAPTVFRCPNLMIDVEASTNFSSVNTTAPTPTYSQSGTVTNTWNYNPGGPGSIVIIRVMYDWPVFGGPLAQPLINQPNQTHLLVGTVVIKNEPYQ